jgi:hypothetical protein
MKIYFTQLMGDASLESETLGVIMRPQLGPLGIIFQRTTW